MKERVVPLKLFRQVSAEGLFKLCSVTARHAIPTGGYGSIHLARFKVSRTPPELCAAEMHVVDTVQVIVLIVPAEATEQHANVQPRHGNACSKMERKKKAKEEETRK